MLQLTNIKKSYKTAGFEQKVLKGVSLALRENEFVAILGQSGSGKTTLLNIIGGLDHYDGGELIINGVSTKRYTSRDWDSYRNHTIGFVFQSYNLIPHQTLLSNVELALTISGISRAERTEKAKRALERVGLSEHIHKKPSQISGGQMQRVAIARALVNDPDILLADEPTGALDSETSIQVMDLLKEVAKDRLVVMVTHNPELAEEYATRIIRLADGNIVSDTDPFDAAEEGAAVHKNLGRTSMSFFTALSLSFNNLLTKKARTALVSLAGSIGIIGIAMIMALSNGVNQYVADIEGEALQNYPLSITDTSFQSALLSAMMGGDAAFEQEASTKDEDAEITEVPIVSGFFSQMVTNDLGSLKEYFESGKTDIYDNVQSIEYGYSIVPQIFTKTKSGVRQINPDQTFSAFGFGNATGGNALISAFSSSDTFSELPAEDGIYKNGYDIKKGRWPENANECVLILGRGGYIADVCVYVVGLKDPAELDDMVKSFLDGAEITVSENGGTYTYDDFIGKSFKVISASELYTYDDRAGVWVNKSSDKEYIDSIYDDAEDLVITGVVEPSEGNKSPMLNMGVGYTNELAKHLIELASESDIVKAQMEDPETNVLTGAAFGEGSDSAFDLGSMLSFDENAFANAFNFDADSLDFSDYDFSGLDFSEMDFSDMDLSDMDLSEIDFSDMDFSDMEFPEFDPEDFDYSSLMPELTEEQVRDILSSIKFDMPERRIRKYITRIWDGYMDYAGRSAYTDYEDLGMALSQYFITKDARQAMLSEITKIWEENSKNFITPEDIFSIVRQLISSYDEYTGRAEGEERDYSRFEEYLNTEEALSIVQEYRETLLQKYKDSLVSDEQVRDLMLNMIASYDDYALQHSMPVLSLLLESFGDYLQSDKGTKQLREIANAFIDSADMQDAISKIFEGMDGSIEGVSEDMFEDFFSQFSEKLEEQIKDSLEQVMEQIMEKIGDAIKEGLEDSLGGFTDTLQDALSGAFSFDANALEGAFQTVMDMDELGNLMMSMYYTEDSSSEANLRKFGYADLAKPSTITIYPLDFEAKERVKAIIDDYNEMRKDAGEDEKVISYADTVGMLMGSVTNIIDVVSAVLIAFVSISLVVSSIMIGVITYISVLERQKEIGILRAIGASKNNISQVFNAEAFIIGFLAGLLGVTITLIAIPPINMIVQNITGQPNIHASLPLLTAANLILLSTVLTLVGGIIPSMKAAKSDPVKTLRSE